MLLAVYPFSFIGFSVSPVVLTIAMTLILLPTAFEPRARAPASAVGKDAIAVFLALLKVAPIYGAIFLFHEGPIAVWQICLQVPLA